MNLEKELGLNLALANNELQHAIIEKIVMHQGEIKSLEHSINQIGSNNPTSCEQWKNKVATIGALVDQLKKRHNELLKPIS